MRRLLVPTSAVCVALVAAACGDSGRHASTRTTAVPTQTVALTATAGTRTATPPPSPAQIEQAAALTAAKPGFTAEFSARINVPQLGGNVVTAIGDGFFDPQSGSGTLDVAVGLPGLLGLTGPLPTHVRLVGRRAYVEIPPDVAGELGIARGWLQDSVSALGLGDSLTPPDILREIARDATHSVAGQRAHVSIDPRTGLVRKIVLRYAVAGGYRVRVRLTLTGFGDQAATAPPEPNRTRDLGPALQALGF